MTALVDLLRTRAKFSPNDVAIISGKTTITWQTLDEEVDVRAAQLIAQGLAKSDRIAIYAKNSVEYITLLLAIWRIGAVTVLFSNRYPSASVQQLYTSLQCKAIWSDTSDSPDDLRLLTFAINTSNSTDASGEAIDANQPAVVVFTSGSTATPKAALLSYGNLYFNALGSNECIPFGTGSRWLLSLPLYHVGGLGILFRALTGGGTIVVPEADESTDDAIRKYGITHLSFVPTQLRRLLDNSSTPPSTKGSPTLLIGGGGLSSALAQRTLDAGLTLYASYGLTEMGSQVCTQRITSVASAPIPCGRTLSHRQLKRAETGEIMVKGETLFLGYCKPDGTLDPARDADGWFATGDLGVIDANGALRVTGRRDNMFISGGENIHPEEIEAALLTIESVIEAVVVPIDDPEFGARPVAFVRHKENRSLQPEQMNKQLALTLPRFKLPVQYLEWPSDETAGQLKIAREWFRKKATELLSRSLR